VSAASLRRRGFASTAEDSSSGGCYPQCIGCGHRACQHANETGHPTGRVVGESSAYTHLQLFARYVLSWRRWLITSVLSRGRGLQLTL